MALSISRYGLFFSMSMCRMINDQFINPHVQIPAQFTEQTRIDPLKISTAIPIEVTARDIQIFTYSILGNLLFLQDIVNAQFNPAEVRALVIKHKIPSLHRWGYYI